MTETIRIPSPNPGARGGIGVSLVVDRKTPVSDRFRRIVDAREYAPVMAQVPIILRTGPGSYSEQIAGRYHHDNNGAIVPWVEPAYNLADTPPPDALQRERVIWDAALGGPGSITNSGNDWAEVGIDDVTVKARSTAIGNQLPVPSDVSYAAFVTGGIGVADNRLPRFAVARKPAKTKRKFKSEKMQTAMYWFLKLAFGYVMTDRDYRSGVFTPRKRIGWNPVVMRRVLDAFSRYITQATSGPGFEPRAGRTRV